MLIGDKSSAVSGGRDGVHLGDWGLREPNLR